MNKKKVFALALAVCLIATLSMGSLAWFTDEDSITNEFLIATSDADTADEVFSVEVWENTPEGEKDYDGYEYGDVLPGDSLLKEVYIENTGYYDQFVRVTVTISDAEAWMSALDRTEIPELSEIVSTINPIEFYGVDSSKVGDDLVYVLYYKNILSPGEKFELFQQVYIPGETMSRDDAALFNKDGHPSFTIEIKAEAVQTKNVGETVYEAFCTVLDVTELPMKAYAATFEELLALLEIHDYVVLVSDITIG